MGKLVAPTRRPSFFAWFSLAWVLPSLIGPAIAGYVTQLWGWRYIFGVVPIFMAAGSIPVAFVLRDLPPQEEHQASPLASLSRNALLAGVGVMALQLAGALPSLVARALVLLAGAVLAAWTLPRLLPHGTFLAHPGMPSAVLARLSAMAALVGLEVMIPLVIQRVHGWDEASAGWWVTVGSLTWAVGSLGQARVHDPVRRRSLPIMGGALMAAGSLPLGLILVSAIPLWIPFIGWLAMGLGIGLLHAPLSVMALEVTPERQHGRVSSWLQVGDSAGPALELAAVSVMMSAWTATGVSGGAAYAPYWVIATALAFVTVFAVLRLRPSSTESDAQSS